MDQLQQEIATWLRILRFIQAETVCLKNRMAAIVSTNPDRNILIQLEDYQNHFVQEDEVLALLHQDIKVQHNNIHEFDPDRPYKWDILLENQERLRQKLEKTEQGFNLLQSNFNRFLLEAL